MKLWLMLSAALAALIFSTGCSKPETAASNAEQKPAGNRYRTELPAGFAAKTIQPGGRCWVDTFNGQRFAPRNEANGTGTLTLEGWAIDGNSAAAPLVTVELTSPDGGQSYYAPAQRAIRRGLGEALKDPALDNAALVSTASLEGVPHGAYLVKLLVGGENSATRCDPNLTLFVK
jgi:hypothetical protein